MLTLKQIEEAFKDQGSWHKDLFKDKDFLLTRPCFANSKRCRNKSKLWFVGHKEAEFEYFGLMCLKCAKTKKDLILLKISKEEEIKIQFLYRIGDY